MMRAPLLLALALVALVGAVSCGGEDPTSTAKSQAVVDPGCTDGDCPVTNPGCTDGGCTPGDTSFQAGCCCGEPAGEVRICCCRSDMVMECRASTIGLHVLVDDVRLCLGQVPSNKASSSDGPCSGPGKGHICESAAGGIPIDLWFPKGLKGAWWPENCGWMNQIGKCVKK